ncbi:MAG: hypothetical protein H6831_09520 [Planctomycetes bacterium]|nr:hypothetical protein [Planctomycetota bacterium]MCB9904633.1 hypothetical protein [Planctomycetota bacterium]
MDLPIHLALFTVVALAIVMLSSFFTEPEDGPALRALPRRMLYFFVGCGVLAGLMLIAEHTVASVH